ncbi:hypothetical protein L596_004906 [Steinernema carpocapsae]|uniref:Uncharacterized protein n=1 Tax=Steinernema carpocapsae TaxID=34508 RepID=A0A4U8UX85_STECR|nr:hypothetical protein L596_004906 [Steinernema carpocapsae]
MALLSSTFGIANNRCEGHSSAYCQSNSHQHQQRPRMWGTISFKPGGDRVGLRSIGDRLYHNPFFHQRNSFLQFLRRHPLRQHSFGRLSTGNQLC